MEPFRLQLMDTLFGNKFMNLTSIEEIQDKATLKVVYTSSVFNLKTKVNTVSPHLKVLLMTSHPVLVTEPPCFFHLQSLHHHRLLG